MTETVDGGDQTSESAPPDPATPPTPPSNHRGGDGAPGRPPASPNGLALVDQRDFKTDMSLIQTIYLVLLTYGLKELGVTLYDGLFPGAHITGQSILVAGLGIALAYLAARFAWASGNIRRFTIHRSTERAERVRAAVLALHFPVLLFHALGIYLLCRLHADLAQPDGLGHLSVFVFSLCALLWVNAAWLLFLVRRRKEKNPEMTWAANNGATAIGLVLVFWTVNAHTLLAMLWPVLALLVWGMLMERPLKEPLALTWALNNAATLAAIPIAYVALDSPDTIGFGWIVVALFMVNSLIDLIRTALSYIAGRLTKAA